MNVRILDTRSEHPKNYQIRQFQTSLGLGDNSHQIIMNAGFERLFCSVNGNSCECLRGNEEKYKFRSLAANIRLGHQEI
jgi:hypothetical protein